MKDQEILGEDSIPGQGTESGSHGMVLSLALWLIRGYRYLISPMTQPSCRFFPSCSEFFRVIAGFVRVIALFFHFWLRLK